MQELSIGRLARETGVKITTIRYYEAAGLLAKPRRLSNNRRTYGADALAQLRFIKHGRELGFDLAAIRQLLDLAAEPNRPCGQADEIARAHLAAIEEKIARLTALKSALQDMRSCKKERVAECRVIEVLADHRLCRADHGPH